MNQHRGFTLVELLIVIVVVAILASISLVAYNGIQDRARDSQRAQDMASIRKALEIYYIENGAYPSSAGCGSSAINSAWCTSSDVSWNNFSTSLSGVVTTVPVDPQNPDGGDTRLNNDVHAYAYFSYPYERCGSTAGNWYLLVHKKSGGAAAQEDTGDPCDSGTALSTYSYASVHIETR